MKDAKSFLMVWAVVCSLAAAQNIPTTNPAKSEHEVSIQPHEAFQQNFPSILAEQKTLSGHYRALAAFLEQSGINGSDKKFLVEQTFYFLLNQGYADKDRGFVVQRAAATLRFWLSVPPDIFIRVLVPYWDHEDPKVRRLAGNLLEMSGILNGKDEKTWEELQQYLNEIQAIQNPRQVPAGFWLAIFEMDAAKALHLMMQLEQASTDKQWQARQLERNNQGLPPLDPSTRDPEQSKERERIYAYAGAINRAPIILDDKRLRSSPDPLALELLRELADNPRWYVRLYVLTAMGRTIQLNRPYYDAAVIESLVDDPNEAVRQKANSLLEREKTEAEKKK